MTYYSQDRNTADVRKKRDFGGFAMFCGTFNDAGRIADRQVKSGTVPQNAGHLAALGPIKGSNVDLLQAAIYRVQALATYSREAIQFYRQQSNY